MREYNLLVVEDDKRIADLICHIANEGGYRAYAAAGFSALKKVCDSVQIDVMVLDILMPDMDGIEVLQFVSPKSSHLRLIILSGSDEMSRRITGNLGVALGFKIEASIKKPFDLNEMRELFTKIKSSLDSN